MVAVLRLKLQGAELAFDKYQQAFMRELGADHDYCGVHISAQRKARGLLVHGDDIDIGSLKRYW